MILLKNNFAFLKKLKSNNDREWFAANKAIYLEQHENTVAFADALLSKMNQHDIIENESGKKSVLRIYRDVRFSKDKSPYKNYWGISFKRATKELRGGSFWITVHLQKQQCSHAVQGIFFCRCHNYLTVFFVRKTPDHPEYPAPNLPCIYQS